MKSRWIYPRPIPENVERELAGYRPIERQVLYMRGIATAKDAHEVLGRYMAIDHDPFLLMGMDQAVARILRALEEEERIVVYGDYDADGVTSTALMVGVLRQLGNKVEYYIPNRFNEGYGLNTESISALANDGATLLISVDCGMRDADKIEHANRLGVDVIVTDHHEPGESHPRAIAVVNPKQEGDPYPFKSLSGVGVAYKLAQALMTRLGKGDPKDALDLVALGTVADVSRLRGENRRLVSLGLGRLNDTRRVGLRELMKAARISPGSVTATSIGFIIGPRLNAAGRLGSADRALRLLTTSDRSEAKDLASELDKENRKRQELTARTVEKVLEIAGEGPEDAVLVFAADESFHEGVVGLAAARLRERFYRPAFVANRGEVSTRGSARSIPGFHVTEALDECADLLARYGGHERAGGFTLDNANVEEFQNRLREIAERRLKDIELIPELEIDAEVDLPHLGEDLLEFIEKLEPCGEGNRAPVLMAKNVTVMGKRTVGADGRHLKLTLKQGGRVIDAIAFRMGDRVTDISDRVDVAFNFERNEYMGIRSLQLNVLDIRGASI